MRPSSICRWHSRQERTAFWTKFAQNAVLKRKAPFSSGAFLFSSFRRNCSVGRFRQILPKTANDSTDDFQKSVKLVVLLQQHKDGVS
jgi:hypothetical protein